MELNPRYTTAVGPEPSAAHAFERLMAATYGMIAKRIDLALLEGQQLTKRLLIAASLGLCGMLLVGSALLAFVYSLTTTILPYSDPVLHAALFGVITLGVALALLIPAAYMARPGRSTEAEAVAPSPSGKGEVRAHEDGDLAQPLDGSH